ncbi:MAG TPA: hypothetical protein VFQ85_17365 [Mycobacteriales bacterium]|nr:hypothetical protein [Mycobacteriales bacterium]
MAKRFEYKYVVEGVSLTKEQHAEVAREVQLAVLRTLSKVRTNGIGNAHIVDDIAEAFRDGGTAGGRLIAASRKALAEIANLKEPVAQVEASRVRTRSTQG